jgi:hypothetical protein
MKYLRKLLCKIWLHDNEKIKVDIGDDWLHITYKCRDCGVESCEFRERNEKY